MAYENLGKCVTLPANADLSASQNCFVDINSSGKVAVAGDGTDAVGVLQDDPAAADRGAIVMVGNGITKVKSGGTCTAGSWAASDSSGRAVNAVSGDQILGQFISGTTSADEIITMLFQKQGRM